MIQPHLLRRSLMALLFLLPWVAPPASAQDAAPDLGTLMDDKTAPLTLALKDLDADWRRFVVSGSDGGVTGGRAEGLHGSVYFTRGQLARAGESHYLVAYQLGVKGPELADLFRPFQGLPTEAVAEITGDTPLVLALLNLNSMGDMQLIEAVDVQQEIRYWHEARLAVEKQVAAAQMEMEGRRVDTGDPSLLNLSQIGQALKAYEDEHDGVLPPMSDATELAKIMTRLVGDSSSLLQPGTKTPYVWNTILSQQDSHNFTGAADIVVVYEAKPAAKTQRGVLLLDGHVRRVSEDEWKRLQKSSMMK